MAAACGARGTVLPLGDYYAVKHASLVALGTGWSVSEPGDAELASPARSLPFRAAAARQYQLKQAEAASIYPF